MCNVMELTKLRRQIKELESLADGLKLQLSDRFDQIVKLKGVNANLILKYEPVLPSGYPTFDIKWTDLKLELEALGVECMLKPQHIPDALVRHTDEEGWTRIMPYLVYPADAYVEGLFDCEVAIETAFGLGLFYADGSCGLREENSYAGAFWRIVGWKEEALERAKQAFEIEWSELTFPLRLYDDYKEGSLTNFGARRKSLYCLEVAPKERHNDGARGEFIKRFQHTLYFKSREKKVPAGVLESSLSSKKAFLEGVIAGDGKRNASPIAVHGRMSVNELAELMDDVRWRYSIQPDHGDMNFRIGYDRRGEGKGKILEYLEGKDFVSQTRISRDTGVERTSCAKYLKELADEKLIEIEKPWRQRMNAKLIAPYTNCDDYARRATSDSAFLFKLNGCLECWGDSQWGYHAYSLVRVAPQQYRLSEPNAGAPWAGELMKFGDNGYVPKHWRL